MKKFAFNRLTLVILICAFSFIPDLQAQQFKSGEDFEKLGFSTFDHKLVNDPQSELDAMSNRFQNCLITKDPRGDETWYFEYDKDKMMTKWTKAYKGGVNDVEITSYKKDVKGRVIEKNTTGTANAEAGVSKSVFEYNDQGNVAKSTIDGNESIYTYDDQNRIIRAETRGSFDGKPFVAVDSYSYDDSGRIISAYNLSTYVDRLTTVVYTTQQRGGLSYEDAVLEITERYEVSGQKKKNIKTEKYRKVFDEKKRLIEYDQANEFSNYIVYDLAGRVQKVFNVVKKAPFFPKLTAYQYDSAGRILTKTENELAGFTSIQQFKTGKLAMKEAYNYQLGTMVRSGEIAGGSGLTLKIRCY